MTVLPSPALADVDDVALGARLLAGIPTNEARGPELLGVLSDRAQRFGRSLADADADEPAAHRVVERTGGLDRDVPTLARFSHRSGTVELFTDSIAFCEDLVDRMGWRPLFPAGSVRAAALLHEDAHHLLAGRYARDLRVAVGHPALRLGRLVRWAHVAGAEELAAHAYAARRLGLGRSPLLVTAAASAALDRPAAVATAPAKEARTWAS
ncbi:hypothetical protein [Pseudonocardia sp. KRD291]|uniref:hypothetical protein n=1 Tax=Pseudonocardia sp. KRD291 TaxID=2792007 RepID=UPI001C4A6966|nr:hypothetical protein [Pseudonocardia sp. KRD291]MBW0104231.1 hypothetical protein [Pseudonocardia sp. KRD291]